MGRRESYCRTYCGALQYVLGFWGTASRRAVARYINYRKHIFDDRLYQLIYSFHMSLFMLISGWLGWYSMKTTDDRREQLQILGRRAASLLIPIFGWTALDSSRHFLMNAYYGYPHAGLGQGLLQYIVNSLENLWFLWAVFWCFLIVWCMHYWFHDALWLLYCGLSDDVLYSRWIGTWRI